MNWIRVASISIMIISLLLWYYIVYGICSTDSQLYNRKQCANIVWGGYLPMIKGFGFASALLLLIGYFPNRKNMITDMPK